MKGYKGFGKGMICRGKQYAENTVFEEDSAEICKSGMHFCKNPFDVLDYYPLVDGNGEFSDFAEVNSIAKAYTDDNKKYCTKKIKIGVKLGLAGFIKAGIDFLYEKTIKKMPKDKSSGDGARIGSLGDGARIGSSGDGARIGSLGDGAQIGSSGYGARIGSSGYGARIGSSGDGAQIGSSGDGARIESAGKNSVIMCAGNGSRAKGKIGSWITLAEWGSVNGEYMPLSVVTKKIDGVEIKEDTFYTLENGEFKEVE